MESHTPTTVSDRRYRPAEAIRTGENRLPTFDTAVDLHRFIDTIQQASDSGRELAVS